MIYHLRLDDGMRWGFFAFPEARPWLEHFAKALGLEDGSVPCGRRIAFERIEIARGEPLLDALKRSHRGTLPARDWQVRALPGLALYEHAEVEDILCGLYSNRTLWGEIEQMQCALFPVFMESLLAGGLPIHGALVEAGGAGIILAGRSGTGKSTACRRLPPPWKVLGDDLCLVVRCPDGTFRAHPVPTWSLLGKGLGIAPGRTGYSVPLRAAFFLEQSKEDEAAPLKKFTAAKAFSLSALEVLRSQCPSFPREERDGVKRAFYDNAASLGLAVPAWRLRVSLTGRFWDRVEESLEGSGTGTGQERNEKCTALSGFAGR